MQHIWQGNVNKDVYKYSRETKAKVRALSDKAGYVVTHNLIKLHDPYWFCNYRIPIDFATLFDTFNMFITAEISIRFLGHENWTQRHFLLLDCLFWHPV